MMTKKRKENANETRKKILESALDLFFDNGYSQTNLDHIAENMGLTKGAIYWHFDSKFDLFENLSSDISEYIKDKFSELHINSLLLSDLKKFLCSLTLLIVKDKKIFKYLSVIFLKIEWNSDFTAITSNLFTEHTKIDQYIERCLSKAIQNNEINPDYKINQILELLTLFLEGIVSNAIIENNYSNIEKKTEMAVEIFFKGLK